MCDVGYLRNMTMCAGGLSITLGTSVRGMSAPGESGQVIENTFSITTDWMLADSRFPFLKRIWFRYIFWIVYFASGYLKLYRDDVKTNQCLGTLPYSRQAARRGPSSAISRSEEEESCRTKGEKPFAG